MPLLAVSALEGGVDLPGTPLVAGLLERGIAKRRQGGVLRGAGGEDARWLKSFVILRLVGPSICYKNAA